MRRHGHQNRHHHQLPHSPHIVIILPVVAREINTIACSDISTPLLMCDEHARVVRCASWRGFVFTAVVVVKITKAEFVGQHHPRRLNCLKVEYDRRIPAPTLPNSA